MACATLSSVVAMFTAGCRGVFAATRWYAARVAPSKLRRSYLGHARLIGVSVSQPRDVSSPHRSACGGAGCRPVPLVGTGRRSPLQLPGCPAATVKELSRCTSTWLPSALVTVVS